MNQYKPSRDNRYALKQCQVISIYRYIRKVERNAFKQLTKAQVGRLNSNPCAEMYSRDGEMCRADATYSAGRLLAE